MSLRNLILGRIKFTDKLESYLAPPKYPFSFLVIKYFLLIILISLICLILFVLYKAIISFDISTVNFIHILNFIKSTINVNYLNSLLTIILIIITYSYVVLTKKYVDLTREILTIQDEENKLKLAPKFNIEVNNMKVITPDEDTNFVFNDDDKFRFNFELTIKNYGLGSAFFTYCEVSYPVREDKERPYRYMPIHYSPDIPNQFNSNHQCIENIDAFVRIDKLEKFSLSFLEITFTYQDIKNKQYEIKQFYDLWSGPAGKKIYYSFILVYNKITDLSEKKIISEYKMEDFYRLSKNYCRYDVRLDDNMNSTKQRINKSINIKEEN